MNKVMVFFIVVMIVINSFILDGIKKEIVSKKKEIEKIEKEIFEYNYIKENKIINDILSKNKVVRKYTYVEAAKEILGYFDTNNVVIRNVNFNKEEKNQVKINMTVVSDYKTLKNILTRIKRTEALIIVNSLQMKIYRGNRYSCEIVMRRVYNV
ncbi:MAG: hypothetical protein FXF47_03305 [Candidatus Mcinerneyibacterium aminivorans]|uniref:Uncharacterized protein n=1 Tax=Candidatus Mcinerneyibacterium aminivorans TaxID=2703815 RepID=A0A5D0MKA3_9BACT|nr:MAG: hypothetical protein FXF47_03305 [Candidatus Mcinerneyibacterium aminivorans]